MVELCFNQSAQGALKMAQHCGGKGRHSVGIVFCTSEDGEKPSRRAVRARLRKVRAEQDRLDRYAVPLGNKSSDVLCLGLALSLGDITAPLAEDGPRRALFRQFHTDFPLDGAEAERAAEADADWREVLAAAEELTRPVLRMLALEWERLREENAPLRAVVNGRVMGVSEDFYDPVLRRCLTEKPQKVANVLGQALVQLSGVGDWLLARRLRAMAEAGTVRVDEAGSTRGFYGAAACLA